MVAKNNDFWEQVSWAGIGELLKKGEFQGTLVRKSTHGAFYDSVEKLAHKSELGFVPRVLLVEKIPVGPVWAQKMPNAAAFPPFRVVLVSKKMMELTGSSEYSAMSHKLETIMAHEFSHIKDGPLNTLRMRMHPYILPLVAVAGLFLYDKAKAKTPRQPGETDKDHARQVISQLDAVTQEEIDKAHAKAGQSAKWGLDPKWQENIMKQGRYFIAAAIGYAAGLALTRHQTLAAEYRADRMATLWSEKPEIFKTALIELHDYYRKHVPSIKPVLDTFDKKLAAGIEEFFNTIHHAHPTLKQRLNHVDRVVAEKAASSISAIT